MYLVKQIDDGSACPNQRELSKICKMKRSFCFGSYYDHDLMKRLLEGTSYLSKMIIFSGFLSEMDSS